MLEESYPKLRDGGGFEILRRGPSPCSLTLIPPPPSGYTVKFLRDTAGLGQAIAFVRPLQCNLSLEVIKPASDHSQDSGSVPKVACINCSLEIPVTLVRQHLNTCIPNDELPDIACIDHDGATSSVSISQGLPILDLAGATSSESISQGLPILDLAGATSSESVSQSTSYMYMESDTGNPVLQTQFDTNHQHQGKLKDLETLFPGTPVDTLTAALQSSSGDVNDAANTLLLANAMKEADDESDNELLQSPFITTGNMPTMTLDDVIHSHKRNLGLIGRESLTISREDLWSESIAIFKNPKFKETARPKVIFEGEAGIDGGGLSKEFGTLLREKIFSSEANLFEGIDGRKLPIYSVEGIYSRMFQLVGKMMSYLIIHLDIPFPCLSPPVYEYIVSGSLEAASFHCCLDDICDYEVKELIGQVAAVKSEEELVSLKQNGMLVESLVNAGWLKDLTFENRNLAMDTLIVHFVLRKRKEPLDQLSKGLRTLNVLDLIKAHPGLMRRYFVMADEKIDSNKMLGLFSVSDEKLDGCAQAYAYLQQGIHKLEEDKGVSGLQRFLHFMTGLKTIPPLGMEKTIEIEFDMSSKSFFAETCGAVLRVPASHQNFETFYERILEACEHNTGFGRI